MLSLMVLALAAAPARGPAGRWHGTSLCQVKPSPCHDEEAVYHISAKGGGRYLVAGNKVVGGIEQEMGVFDAVFTPASGLLAWTTSDRSGQPARWTFRLHGDRLSGRLVSGDGLLYRLIELRREPAR